IDHDLIFAVVEEERERARVDVVTLAEERVRLGGRGRVEPAGDGDAAREVEEGLIRNVDEIVGRARERDGEIGDARRARGRDGAEGGVEVGARVAEVGAPGIAIVEAPLTERSEGRWRGRRGHDAAVAGAADAAVAGAADAAVAGAA